MFDIPAGSNYHNYNDLFGNNQSLWKAYLL